MSEASRPVPTVERVDAAEFHVLAARVRVAQAKAARESAHRERLMTQALEHLQAAHEAMGGAAGALSIKAAGGRP